MSIPVLLRNGLPLLPVQPKGAPVDLELVNSLRDSLAQAHPARLKVGQVAGRHHQAVDQGGGSDQAIAEGQGIGHVQ